MCTKPVFWHLRLVCIRFLSQLTDRCGLRVKDKPLVSAKLFVTAESDPYHFSDKTFPAALTPNFCSSILGGEFGASRPIRQKFYPN